MTQGESHGNKYDIAEGPDGLKTLLESYLDQSQNSPDFAQVPHYIVYRYGNQESVMKVDMSEEPYLFWYYDMLGRPMTDAVREVIASFLWNDCGENRRRSNMSYEMFKKELPNMEDNYKEHILPALLRATMEGGPYSD